MAARQTTRETSMSEHQTPLDMQAGQLAIVRDILHRYVPDRKVLAFGSRAKKTARQYSDLDLTVVGDEPLSLDIEASLAEAFRESDLIFKVDVVDWAKTSPAFREIIARNAVVVQEGEGLDGVGT